LPLQETPTVGTLGRGICSTLFLDEVLVVPSSSIIIATDGECLACGGFSLGKPVRLGNFEFIANYFGSLSLSPRRGNGGAVIVGSTHSRASTPQRAMIKDSPEEFLTASSGEGSFGPLPPLQQCSMGGPLALTTIMTWKKNVLATMTFPLRTVVPRPKTHQPSEQHHAHHEGQLAQSCAQHPHADEQTATMVQPDASPRFEPMLKAKRILMLDFTST
jgi:hypothetical protein